MNDLMFIKKIHFLGIGGSGMSGIAEILSSRGYSVSGSDLVRSTNVERLEKLGVEIFDRHAAENLDQVDVVIRSSAINDNNPEIIAAKKMNLPVIPRAQMLAELMRFKFSIAVAGSHGKTSTTSILSDIFTNANLDPTFVIGGVLRHNQSNARLGKGKYFIIEADESDASFLYYNPMVVIITNIEAEHLDAYGGSFDKLKENFIKFVHRLPFYGLAIICYDDPILRELLPYLERRVITYGFHPRAEVVITDYQQIGFKSSFAVNFCKSREIWNLTFNLPGKHYVSNSVASIIAAREIAKIDQKTVANSLSNFSGVKRRMECYGEVNLLGKRILLIDDYGHHPTEIINTIETLKQALPNKKILMVFQPHRYTRTRDCFEQMIEMMALVDKIILLDIYSAGEQPISGISSQKLADNASRKFNTEILVVADNRKVMELLPSVVNNQEILLIQGAGNIGNLVSLIMNKYGNY